MLGISNEERRKRNICLGDAWDGRTHWPCEIDPKKDGYCPVHHPDAQKRRDARSAERQAQASKDMWRRIRAEDRMRRHARAYPKLLAEVKRLRKQLKEMSNNIPEKELKKVFKK